MTFCLNTQVDYDKPHKKNSYTFVTIKYQNCMVCKYLLDFFSFSIVRVAIRQNDSPPSNNQ